MTFSANLQRHIHVPIDQLNRVDEAELDAAIAALPGYPDTDPATVIDEAARGNLNAMLILDRAAEGDPIALDWL